MFKNLVANAEAAVLIGAGALAALSGPGAHAQGDEKGLNPGLRAPEAPPPKTVLVTTGPLNLRDRPSRDGAVLGRVYDIDEVLLLERGAAVETIGDRTGYWYKVETSYKKRGWMFFGYPPKRPLVEDAPGLKPLENCIAYAFGEIILINYEGERVGSVDYDGEAWYPVLSPDGRKIAVTVSTGYMSDICLMNADGSGDTSLFTWEWNCGGPCFSPDGSKIAIAGIYTINMDGSWLMRLIPPEYGGFGPAFSPDGSKVAFVSSRDGHEEIYVMNADGSGPVRLTRDGGSNYGPAFSPDGSKIVFSSVRDDDSEIYVMNADGSGRTRLTHNPAWDKAPVYSPDGKKIAFVSRRDGHEEIYLMNADGSYQRRLTYGGGGAPSFSPMRVDGVLLDTYGRVIEE